MLWKFTPYTEEARTGGNIYAPRISAGETETLSPYMWSTVKGRNDIELEVSCSEEIASYSYNSSTQTLSLEARDYGVVSISIYGKNEVSGRALAAIVSVTLQLPFEQGVYFFKNKEYNKYMNISATASDTEMKLSGFDVASRYRFEVVHSLDGYYKIINDANNKVVSVPSSETDTNDEPLIYETDTGADTQLWSFTLTSRGSYVIRPKSGASENASKDWCMCAGYDGSNVEQREYNGTNNSYKDEWELIKILPISGYEVDYNPSLWNNTDALLYSNCYNYALDKLNTEHNGTYTKMQPGVLAGQTPYDLILEGYSNGIPVYFLQLKSPSIIQNCAMLDANAKGFTFTPIGRYDVCPEGTYKVALVVDSYDDPNYESVPELTVTGEGFCYIEYPDTDYHWYRQNPDGTWSHKLGPTEATLYDASGDIILDPQICDRDYGEGLIYSIFVGYYAVSPLD